MATAMIQTTTTTPTSRATGAHDAPTRRQAVMRDFRGHLIRHLDEQFPWMTPKQKRAFRAGITMVSHHVAKSERFSGYC